jgi:hypothetical protein
MSDPPADVHAFPATTGALRRELVSPAAMAAAAIAVTLAIAVVDAAWRGPWLDEFWTLELSDARDGLPALVRDGWLRDTHPPLFNAWASLLASLGLGSIAAGRLVTNLLAAALLIATALCVSRRTPAQAGVAACLLLLVLPLPQAMESFGIYRSYFWQMAAIGMLALIAHHVAMAAADLRWRRDADLAVIAVLATASSIGLHYVGGLFGGLLAGAIALSAFARGLRRWGALMLVSATLSGLLVMAMLALQAPVWAAEFDHRWIDLPLFSALGVVATLAAAPLWLNPVALLGLRLVGLYKGTGARDARETRFVVMIGGVLATGVAIVLAVHVVVPIVVDRYLFAVPVLVGALLAVPAARVARNRLLFGLLVLLAMAGAARPLIETGIRPFWREDARTIAGIVTGCPTTEVYAASAWALGPAAASRMARREDPVFERGYGLLAAEHGFTVRFIGQKGGAHATPGACPVLLWYAHTPDEAENDLPAAIEAAGLTGLEKATLSVTRSATGFVVRADAASSQPAGLTFR